MKITDVRITLLRLPYVEQPAWSTGYSRDREVLLAEVETASGHVGLGYQLYLREGMRTTKAAIQEMHAPRVLGRNATEVEGVWHDLWTSSLADGRGGAPVLGDLSEFADTFAGFAKAPSEVAELVLAGVVEERFWIETDDVFRAPVRARHSSIEERSDPPARGMILAPYLES